MGKYCFISSCSTNGKESLENGDSRKSLFKFPKNEILFEKWKRNIEKYQNCESITKHSKICLNHFEEKFLIDSGKLCHLSKDAYPTIFSSVKKEKSILRLTETSEKCRFCLKKFEFDNRVEISKAVQKQFINLTQTELRSSDIYSNFICKTCHQGLKFSYNFKHKLIENQLKLHEALETFEDEEDNKIRVDNESDSSAEPDDIMNVKTELFHGNLLEVNLNDTQIKQENEDSQTTDNLGNITEIQPHQRTQTELSESKEDFQFPTFGDVASFDFPILEVPTTTKKTRKRKLENDEELKTSKKQTEASILRKKESVLCSECGGVFKRKSLRKHIDRAHKNIRKYGCDICGHQSYHKYQMRNHITIHTKEKHYICQECGKMFSNPALLSSHRNSMHLKSDERPHECRECNKQFKHKKDLKIHIRFSHLKEKRYFCEFENCGKTFNSRLHFNDHLAKHSGEPSFACEDCGKFFFSEFKLKNHKALHVRAFCCNLCDKRFPKEYKLNAHLRVHSGQRDYACNYCDNKYFSKSHLNRHVLNYHINLKLKCEVPGCTSIFSKKESYKSHLLALHRNLEENSLKEILAKIRDIRPVIEEQFFKTKPKQE